MISILIDTYNHEAFIRTAIESVLAQGWLNGRDDYEIVVVDDGSQDATPAVLAGFGDAIRVVRKTNGGQASAFAEGLAHCSGDIVFFLDGDDWWREDKIATVMAAFEAHPDCIAIGHGIVIADELSGAHEELAPAQETIVRLAAEADVRPFLRHRALLGTSRLAARRAALDRIGPPPAELIYEADEHYFTLLPAIGEVRILPECLTGYRLHGGNLYQPSKSLAGKALGLHKLQLRARIFRCLADTLPKRLAELGTDRATIDALREPLNIEASRLELQAFGGARRKTFDVERRSQAWLAGEGVRSSLPVRAATLAASILLSPRSFYSLRTRYAGARARGDARPAPGLGERAQKGNS